VIVSNKRRNPGAQAGGEHTGRQRPATKCSGSTSAPRAAGRVRRRRSSSASARHAAVSATTRSPCRLHGLLPASPQGPRERRHARRPHTAEEDKARPTHLLVVANRRLAADGPDARVSSRASVTVALARTSASLWRSRSVTTLCCFRSEFGRAEGWILPPRQRVLADGADGCSSAPCSERPAVGSLGRVVSVERERLWRRSAATGAGSVSWRSGASATAMAAGRGFGPACAGGLDGVGRRIGRSRARLGRWVGRGGCRIGGAAATALRESTRVRRSRCETRHTAEGVAAGGV
jgi:hypothetical protein